MSNHSRCIVASCFNADPSWLLKYNVPIYAYDKTWDGAEYENISIPKSNLAIHDSRMKLIKSCLNGYNLYDYFYHIIENYSNLPDYVCFVKANIVPRHLSIEYFESHIMFDGFKALEDLTMHDLGFAKNWSIYKQIRSYAMISSDGGFLEKNNNWYARTNRHPYKYFRTFDEMMTAMFNGYISPPYIRFAPGANYIVPKSYIQKYPILFYRKLLDLVSHHQLCLEAHHLERAFYSIFNSNYTVNSKFLNTKI